MSKLRGMIAGGVLLISAMVGCSGKQEPAHGELMVALSSDMSIPKDVTHIRINILVNNAVTYQYDFEIAPDGQFHLPGTLAIVAGKTESPIVSVEVIGIRNKGVGQKEARTFSKVVTTVPKSRLALLRVPVQWLCDNSALALGDDSYASTCDPVNGEEAACAAGSCKPVKKDEGELTTYSADQVFGGAPGPDLGGGQCFDTVACLQAGQDMVPAADCSLSIPDAVKSPNVGLVLAPGGDGICPMDPSADCFIPLDRDSSLGWQFRNPAAATGRVIELPSAVCMKLTAGAIQAVRLSNVCPTKTLEVPTCGPWSSVVPSDGGVPDGGMPDGSMPDGSMPDASMPDAMPADSGMEGGDAGGDSGMDGGAQPPPGCTDPLSFGDPTLEAAVRMQIGIPSPTPIRASNAASVQTLNLTYQNLTTLAGVECFANLTSLFVDGNQLSDLTPLSTFTRLTRLDAGNNKFSDVSPLASLTSLTLLEMQSNQIVDVAPLGSLTNLTSLILSSNLVQDPSPLGSLTKLTMIDLDSNPITDPAKLTSVLTSLANVQDIRVSGVNVDLTALAQNTNITFLSLIAAGITDLTPLSNLKKLTGLDLNGNMITDLTPLSGLPLTDLHVNMNPITDLSVLGSLPALTHLEAGDLQLESSASALSLIGTMTQLQWLSMNGDGLNDIGPLASLSNLVLLFVGGNAISDITPLQGLLQLQHVDLSSNMITTLAPLANNAGLGTGDDVRVTMNPLDCTAEAAHIAALKAAGVQLSTDCP